MTLMVPLWYYLTAIILVSIGGATYATVTSTVVESLVARAAILGTAIPILLLLYVLGSIPLWRHELAHRRWVQERKVRKQIERKKYQPTLARKERALTN